MKSPDFAYIKAKTLTDVFTSFETHGESAQILAGGQSLLAMMNLRMAQPTCLIDISGIESLNGINKKENVISIGALTTHNQILQSDLINQHIPLLAQAVPYVAHLAIRNRGTMGGSLALGDPAAEYPAVALALNATLLIQSAQGERRVKARDFFISLYRTAVQSNEVLTGVEFPVAQANQRFAFLELARRKGDYAMVGLAAAFTMDKTNILECALSFMAMDDKPILATQAMQSLAGKTIDKACISQAQQALDKDLNPSGDLNANASTKKHLARVLLGRALEHVGDSHV
jgi:carbon-monoxide dehydrogenase medium subunit